MKIFTWLVPVLFAAGVLCSACSPENKGMQDGYYTAEMASFDKDGWKEFMTICVSNNKIVTIEYDARNSGGFIKSWDVGHMRRDEAATGYSHNTPVRLYASELIAKQNPTAIRPLPGAKDSYELFRILAEAAIVHAKTGDRKIALVAARRPNEKHESVHP